MGGPTDPDFRDARRYTISTTPLSDPAERQLKDLLADASAHPRMINRTPELDAFEARWSAQTRVTSSPDDAFRWFDAALAHARAMGAPPAKPFASHEEARRVLASDIRVAAALHALETIRESERKTDTPT